MAELEEDEGGVQFLGLHHDPEIDGIDVKLHMMDYDYVKKSENVTELKAILRKLQSGNEGRYPRLEKATEEKILTLMPLKQRQRIQAMRRGPTDNEVSHAMMDLKDWVQSINIDNGNSIDKDNCFGDVATSETIATTGYKSQILVGGKLKTKDKTSTIKSKVAPGVVSLDDYSSSSVKQKHSNEEQRVQKEKLSNADYFRAWDQFDSTAAEEKIDMEEKLLVEQSTRLKVSLEEKMRRAKERQELELQELRCKIQYNALSKAERLFSAGREKQKGNESFKVGEHEEAAACYSKSLALDDTNATVYSNRALTLMRSGEMEQALSDATTAIGLDSTYTKARLRRAMIHHQCGRYEHAIRDFEVCTQMEPSNAYFGLMLECCQKKCDEVTGVDHRTSKQEYGQQPMRRISISIAQGEEDDDDEENARGRSTCDKEQEETTKFCNKIDDNAKSATKSSLSTNLESIMIGKGKRPNESVREDEVIEEVYTPGAKQLMNASGC
jgi:tetratricopeptide (TPR) repeat protein